MELEFEQREPGERGRRHPRGERQQPAVERAHQHEIDEQPRERGQQQARNHQRDPDQHDEPQRAFEPREARADRSQHAAPLVSADELRARNEREQDSAEPFGKLLDRLAASARSGVVDPDVLAVAVLDHEEVVEVDERHRRQRQLGKVVRLRFQPARFEPQRASGADQAGCLAAVARNPAQPPQFLQRQEPAVVGQHHPERRGPAFGGFQLEKGRNPAAARHYSGPPETSSPMTRRRSATTDPPTSVPGVICRAGPCDADQR